MIYDSKDIFSANSTFSANTHHDLTISKFDEMIKNIENGITFKNGIWLFHEMKKILNWT